MPSESESMRASWRQSGNLSTPWTDVQRALKPAITEDKEDRRNEGTWSWQRSDSHTNESNLREHVSAPCHSSLEVAIRKSCFMTNSVRYAVVLYILTVCKVA